MRDKILSLVAERSGLVFAPNRLPEVEAGLARAMQHTSATSLGSYLKRVRGDSALLDRLVEELTVGETHFMRDPEQMEVIRSEVFPTLSRRRAHGLPPRVWSVGCATGEEAYSLAILLEEEGLSEGAVVLGTDLSTAALEKAKVASYAEWSMRGVSAKFREDYFRRVQGHHVLVNRIRSQVRFCRLNLVSAEDYAAVGAYGMDLILCRNVLIYFDQETAAQVAERLFSCLAPGGVLLTAGADPLLAEHAPFEVELTRAGLLYRRSRPPALRAEPTPPVAPRPPATVAAAPSAEAVGADPAREAFLRVMEHANAKGARAAERIAQAALRRHPLDAPLHYVRATLLLATDQDEEAEHAALRALYLDRTLAIAHFLLGTILRKRGARKEALRAFRNVRDLCAARPSDEELPAGAGERAGSIHAAASLEMAQLEVAVG
jgi:chemotaxis protein methyltransferase CheR